MRRPSTAPVPVLVDIVHVASGATWLSGLVSLAVLSDFGGRFDPPSVRAILPRYSALAIVSVGLVSATGIYADWTQTRDIVSTATPYAINLDVKVLLVLGGPGHRCAQLRRRRDATGAGSAGCPGGCSSSSASPSASSSSRPTSRAARRPGRTARSRSRRRPRRAPRRRSTSRSSRAGPGPNRFIAAAGGTPAPAGTTVTLLLQRLDSGNAPGPDRAARRDRPVRRGHLRRRRWPARGRRSLGRDGHGRRTPSGAEVGRRHFTFSVDAGRGQRRSRPAADRPRSSRSVSSSRSAACSGWPSASPAARSRARRHAWSRRVLVAGSGVGHRGRCAHHRRRADPMTINLTLGLVVGIELLAVAALLFLFGRLDRAALAEPRLARELRPDRARDRRPRAGVGDPVRHDARTRGRPTRYRSR